MKCRLFGGGSLSCRSLCSWRLGGSLYGLLGGLRVDCGLGLSHLLLALGGQRLAGLGLGGLLGLAGGLLHIAGDGTLRALGGTSALG
ncbi:MAG: hypothetical protein IJ146_08515, partial [Kiritimatiellae bacterium]|nr:hypothetical protein [Kiritimatiellia bacterium]